MELGILCVIHKYDLFLNSAELQSSSFHWTWLLSHIIWRYYIHSEVALLAHAGPRTAVKPLAHKKLPLCHIKIQFKAPDTTLIKSSWKEMLVYQALQLAKLWLCWTIRGSGFCRQWASRKHTWLPATQILGHHEKPGRSRVFSIN